MHSYRRSVPISVPGISLGHSIETQISVQIHLHCVRFPLGPARLSTSDSVISSVYCPSVNIRQMLRTALRAAITRSPTHSRAPTLTRLTHTALSNIYTMSRLIRFIPHQGSSPVIGEPVDTDIDVGLATYKGEEVKVDVYDGSSILAPGKPTGRKAVVGRLLSPLAKEEVGTIRAIGLNVRQIQRSGRNDDHDLTSSICLTPKRSTCLSPPPPSCSSARLRP